MSTLFYRLFSHTVVTMETSAIGWPPWLITFWYLLISEQLHMPMHEAMTWFLQIQRYQNGINQGGHPIALVSMATTLCETRLYLHHLFFSLLPFLNSVLPFLFKSNDKLMTEEVAVLVSRKERTTDEKRAKIGLWLNMRSVCCAFLGIIGLLSQRRLFKRKDLV